MNLNYLCDQRYADLAADTKYHKDNLFEDSHFKASNESIFLSEDRPTFLKTIHENRDIKWLRPSEIVKGKQKPMFFKDGPSFNGIMLPEGHVNHVNGNFMKALAAMTFAPSVLNFVCPKQSFSGNYKGIFRFRFWKIGKWYEVVIDDRLPTLDGKLMFSRSLSNVEFWVSLMEKALAKLLTRYEAIDYTFEVSEALLDLSGGTVETVQLAGLEESFLCSKLKMYAKTGSLMTACISSGHSDDCGLKESLYILPDVENITYDRNGKMSTINLVRVISTDRYKWTGPWGDKSKEMKILSAKIKKKFEKTTEIDGGFWMALKDFMKRFKELRVLHIPAELSDKDIKWKVTEYYNKWQKGTTAAGCFIKNKQDFHLNPQYNINVVDGGELAIVSLMAVSKDRGKTSWEGYHIGLDVFRLEDSDTCNREFMEDATPLHTQCGVCEVTLGMVLKPGNYFIIPSTYEPDKEIPFLIRSFAGSSFKMTSAHCRYTETLTSDHMELDPMMVEIIHAFFDEHAGEDQLMDTSELDAFFVAWKENELIPTDISHETSAAIAALYDEDNSRQLCRDEILAIGALSFYCDITFSRADKDKSGTIDAREMRDALSQAGLVSSDAVLYHLVGRYVRSDNKITFQEFFLVVTKLRYIIRKYEQLGGSNEKPVEISVEDLLDICSKL